MVVSVTNRAPTLLVINEFRFFELFDGYLAQTLHHRDFRSWIDRFGVLQFGETLEMKPVGATALLLLLRRGIEDVADA